MKLAFIDQDYLVASPVNMRAAKKRRAPIDSLLSLVRARGVLVPLLVRPNGEPDHYEIVAGLRRYDCAPVVTQDTGNRRAAALRDPRAGRRRRRA